MRDINKIKSDIRLSVRFLFVCLFVVYLAILSAIHTKLVPCRHIAIRNVCLISLTKQFTSGTVLYAAT